MSLKVQGVDLISLHTSKNSRALLTTSIGVIFIYCFGLNGDPWRFFNRDIPPFAFSTIAFAVILLQFFALIVSWSSDYVSYTKWFKRNEVPSDTIDTIGSFDRSTQSMIDAIRIRMERVAKVCEEVGSAISRKKMDGDVVEFLGEQERIDKVLKEAKEAIEVLKSNENKLENDISDLKKVLGDVGANWGKMKLVARFVVFFWHLAFPIFVAVVAVAFLIFGSHSTQNSAPPVCRFDCRQTVAGL